MSRPADGLVPLRSPRGQRAHGVRRTYTIGCRCEPCCQANRDYKNAYRAMKQAGIEIPVRNALPESRMQVEQAWREHALCVLECRAGRADHGWWASDEPNTQDAVEICERCPVRDDCLQWALEMPEPVGIWGGTTPKQRRRLAS